MEIVLINDDYDSCINVAHCAALLAFITRCHFSSLWRATLEYSAAWGIKINLKVGGLKHTVLTWKNQPNFMFTPISLSHCVTIYYSPSVVKFTSHAARNTSRRTNTCHANTLTLSDLVYDFTSHKWPCCLL